MNETESFVLSDRTGEIRAKVRIGQISNLDSSYMDGQVGFGL